MIAIERKDTEVLVKLRLSLPFTVNVYPFKFNCNDTHYAYLLMRHIEKDLEYYLKKVILEDFCWRLSPSELTLLKKKLKNWDSKNNQWK